MHLGPYELIDCVGAGSSALVWRARDPSSGQAVAIKVLTGDLNSDPERLAAFRIEARAAARLSHRNVVRLLDQGEVGRGHGLGGQVCAGAPYLVMQYMQGGSLSPHRGQISAPALFSILRDILDGLAHAHAHGLIHRDIKPANLMLAASGRACLADFGLAWRTTKLLGGGALAGTPNYMAPEQIQGGVLGPGTDLYALGCTAWALCTGRAPFAGRSVEEALVAHLSEQPGVFEPQRELPAGMERWVRILLRKGESERFARAADARSALLAVEAGETPVLGAPVFVGTGWREQMPEALPAGVGLGVLRLRQLPLVGREDERREIWAALGEVHRQGGPRLVLLEGGEGLGKMRLGQWVLRRSEELGHGCSMWARHAPELARSHGFSGLLARQLGLLPLARQERGPRLLKALEELGLAEELEGVQRLLGGAWVGREIAPPTPQEACVVLGRVLRAMSRERPVVLLLAELQWGAGSLALLLDTLELEPDLRLLILGTLRADQLPGRTEAPLVQRLRERVPTRSLHIGGLGAEDQRLFLGQLIGLEPALVEQVSARSGGHPVFAMAIVGDWAAGGHLEPGPAGLRLRQGTRVEIPDSIHLAFMGRLRPLLAGTGGLGLMGAAVLGEQVSVREWRRLCAGLELQIEPAWMQQLVRDDLAAPDPGGRSWSWSHALVRESVLRSAREAGHWVALHAACAQVLSKKSSPSHRQRRAGHLLEAGERQAAVSLFVELTRYYLSFGDRVAAEALLHRLEGLRLGAPDGADWVRHDLHRSWLAWETGLASAGALMRSAEARARRLGDGELLAELLLADIPRRMETDPDSVAAVLEETGGLVRNLGRPDLKLRHTARVAAWLGRQGAHQAAVVQIEHRLKRTPAGGDRRVEEQRLHLLRTLAWSLTRLGRTKRASDVLLVQLARYREIGHGMMVAQCLNALGEVARMEGDHSRARAWYLEALSAGEQAGLERLIAYPELNLGVLETQLGELQVASRHLERAELLFKKLNRPAPRLAVCLCQAVAAVQDPAALSRRLREAERLLPRVSEVDPDIGWLAATVVRRCPSDQREAALRIATVLLRDLEELDLIEQLRTLERS